jgi:hypothetical protein
MVSIDEFNSVHGGPDCQSAIRFEFTGQECDRYAAVVLCEAFDF